MTTATWSALLGQYWTCSWLKSPQDVDAAATELRETFRTRSPDNDELVRAVRWLAGPENKQAKCPTLRELVRAVAILRKKDRGDDAATAQACGLCKNGWLSMYADWNADWTLADYMMAYCVAVPCLCSEGNRVTELAYGKAAPDVRAKIEQHRTTALEQCRARAMREAA